MMNITEASVPKKSKPLAFRNVGGEEVIIHLEKSLVYLLNGIGGAVWSQIDGSRNVREIVSHITATYEVDVETAASDCLDLIGELAAKGLLHVEG